MNTKLIAGLALGVIAIFGGWYYFSNSGQTNAEIVATVNGEEITRDQLSEAENLIASGQDITTLDEATRKQLETQALENLISATLLKQAAADAGITVTEEQINTQLSSIKGQFQDDSAYQQALALQGITEDKLREEVSNDLLINSYITQAVDLTSVTVTDEEVQTLYDQEKDINPELAPLADLREQIVAFITQQKQQQLIGAHVAELRANAEVEVLI